MRPGRVSLPPPIRRIPLRIRAFVVVASCLVLAGCATIMHGSGQDVGFSSTPTAAKVTVDNKPLGNTPVIAKLARKDNHVVKMELEGFQPFEATLTRKTSGWVWGNVLFGGLIGLAVDAISGGLYNLTPEQVAGQLAKQSASGFGKNDKVAIFVVMQADSSWQRVGTLTR